MVSKLSGDAGALGAEDIELRNWLLRFVCALEEFIFIVVELADWMTNSPHPWTAYCSLMANHLVARDKRPWVHPVGIW